MSRFLGSISRLVDRIWLLPAPIVAAVSLPGASAAGIETRDDSFASTMVDAMSVGTYQANSNFEDRHQVAVASDSVFACVMDGHGGWQAAEYAKNHLINNVVIEQEHSGDVEEARGVPTALIRGFERTDREFIDAIRSAFRIGFGETGHVGACAVCSVVTSKHIFVANAGDCRAVLGVAKEGGPEVVSVDLSRDHNCRSLIEQQKLAEEHPGERDIVKCKSPTACYVKGRLQPTRSLGDAYLKYSEFNGPRGDRLRGRHVRAPYTPPYISATPEIMVHGITGNEKFIVLASDGVWDVMSSQDTVDFINADTGKRDGVAERLCEKVLEKTAELNGMTLEKMKEVRPPFRRRLHDDLTVVILFFGNDEVTHRKGEWFQKQAVLE